MTTLRGDLLLNIYQAAKAGEEQLLQDAISFASELGVSQDKIDAALASVPLRLF